MEIDSKRVWKKKIPLRIKVKHAQAEYAYSENIFMKVVSGELAGYGECVPRSFMPGYDTAYEQLQQLKLKASIKNMDDAVRICKTLNMSGCGRCAAELAILDLAGKAFNKPVSAIFKTKPHDVVYSAVIPTDSMLKTRILAHMAKRYGFRQVKLKVGFSNDLARVKLVKSIMPDCDLRVDANFAWKTDEAIRNIAAMQALITAVEQPVRDIDAMAEVKAAVKVPIVADESLCTIEDAKKLIRNKACDIFDIRLSKCGGLLNAREIYKLGRKHGISSMLGCQVGETAILSAAGRHFAQSFELKYVEGSYDRWLLRENVAENMMIMKGGIGLPISETGLGLRINAGFQ
jgi:L-Ala-D/L-Glu epimerase